MSNSYFQFRQFRIEQGDCAMKVSTDACIQGAWTPIEDTVKMVLDIGTGTGLLSLMLAQCYPDITLDAIELDDRAAQQAVANAANSPWANRINVIHGDASTYPFTVQYDFIICNPPFFNNSLLGDNGQRNQARHTLSLTYQQLFSVLEQHLSPTGLASIMLPLTEHEQWQALLQQNGWYIHKKLLIEPTEGKQPNRVVSLSGRHQPTVFQEETLAIRDKENNYTPEFTDLLKDFYLNL